MTPDESPPFDDAAAPSAPSARHQRRRELRVVTADHAKDPRPEIVIGHELACNVDDAIAALASDPNLYARSGKLVFVAHATTDDAADERAPVAKDSPIIHEMAHATLLERLSSRARFMKFDRRSNAFVRTLPTKWVTAAVHARKEWPGIRKIVGIVTTPTMRPDGTVVQSAGYDDGTGYLLAPNAIFPRVADRPTRDNARDAFARLSRLFVDFPFVDEAARMVPIAALLSLVARPAIVGPVPCFAFDAPTRGTGKGLAASVPVVIATGQAPPLATFPASDDHGAELEKMLGSYALSGAPVVFFDNVPIGCAFGGAPLEKVLTAPDVVSLRILGRTETPTLPWRAVVIVAGNNLAVADETARRVLLARMVSPLERPEERTGFAFPDLLAHARDHRTELVSDALTILRAYTAARSRDGAEAGMVLGSYEAWSKLVPRAIVFAGGADVLGARVTLTGDTDSDATTHAAILAHLPRLVGNEGLDVKSILDALFPQSRADDDPPDGHAELRDAIASATDTRLGQRPTTAKLGTYFRGIRDRNVGGRALRVVSTHARASRWGVR